MRSLAAFAEQAVDRDRRSCLRHRRDAARARPRLPPRQTWRLVDNDLSLLARAALAGRRDVHVSRPCRSISSAISKLALDGPVDLVTTSALLDLVSAEWLERLVVERRRGGCRSMRR